MSEPEAKRPRVILKGKTVGEANGGSGGGGVQHAAAAVEVRNALRTVPAVPQVTRFRAPPRATDSGGSALATFDVGGRIYKVPAQLVRSKPGTRLAQLIENAGESSLPSKPIFVDAAPERFTCILDWYRYGEIHVPKSISIPAVLQDARTLQLPEELVVNGATLSTRPRVAHRVGRDLVAGIIKRWPGFPDLLQGLLDSIRLHYQAVGDGAAPTKPATAPDGDADEAYDFTPFVLTLYGEEKGWLDTKNICSAPRARVLGLKLEEHGFRCEFTETELVVNLPLRLRGEAGGVGHEEEEALEDAGGDLETGY